MMTMSLEILCINIQLIIFADFMLQYAVKGEYPNFRGAWLNDTHFLVAKRFYQDREYFKLEAHEVGEFNQYSGRIMQTYTLIFIIAVFWHGQIIRATKRWGL